jgi:signal transduction histidine kinase
MLAALLAVLCLCGALLAVRREIAVLKQGLSQERAAHQGAIRLLRLTAADLRAPALTLQSHAEQGEPALRVLSRKLLDVAEGLLEQTEQPGARRQLREEKLPLGPLVDFVVTQVRSHLGPGQRAWHISDTLQDVTLLADRRAVHQVLLRVVTCAALATRDLDWIDIDAAENDEFWALVVQDEGHGLPVAEAEDQGPETRGLGVGLALARSLMQAHGGTLTIESAARIGTRAIIRFPRNRLIAA